MVCQMDYTLIDYDVNSWEGKAYKYGLQARASALGAGRRSQEGYTTGRCVVRLLSPGLKASAHTA